MKLLIVGTDRKLFDPDSAVSLRQIKYGRLVEHSDIIVYAKKSLALAQRKLSPQVSVYPTNSYSKFFYFIDAFFLARKLNRPNIVSAQDPFESGLAAYLISRYFSVPLHLQLHTDFLSPYFSADSFLNKIRVVLARFLIKRAAMVRVVSERIKNSIIEAKLKDAQDIFVLPVFVDSEKIRSSLIHVDLHKKYSQFDFIILMASRLSKEKNINLAIEAMLKLVSKYPKAGLIIVGDGPEKNDLELKVRNLKLADNIFFESWSNDLVSYYKTADLFLLTSNYEGYGMTVVEALSSGLPVIMTDVGCAGDVLINNEDGLILPVDDLDKLVSSIEKFLSDRDLLSVMRNKIAGTRYGQTENEYLQNYSKSWGIKQTQ